MTMLAFKVFAFVCFLSAAVYGEGSQGPQVQSQPQENQLLKEVYRECLEKDAVSCVKYKVYSEVDKVLDEKDKETITVTEGVQIVKSEDAEEATPETEGAPRAQADSAEAALLNKALHFVETRSMKIDVNGKDLVNTAKSAAKAISDYFTAEDNEEIETEEARGKKKKIKKAAKFLGPIFGLIALKKAFLIKLMIVGVALLAGKALLVSKIALVLAAIIGLKKLFAAKSGGGHAEIVAAPVHTVSHVAHDAHSYGGGYADSHDGGWARNADAQALAYKAYKTSAEVQS